MFRLWEWEYGFDVLRKIIRLSAIFSSPPLFNLSLWRDRITIYKRLFMTANQVLSYMKDHFVLNVFISFQTTEI